ncbi:MAG: EthD family reductase, partial [Acidobacteria bacterium]|nr:EthD family reductase [Acidobacteriota bacterium]
SKRASTHVGHMLGANLVVLYPYARVPAAIWRAYTEQHVPMVNQNTMKGITKFVATKVIGTADGSAPPFYRMAELHFPSLAALQECASSASAQEAVAHAVSISSGGKPLFLVAEEETTTF